ncbi:hypothetical protein E5D57_005824 [Metarhizium anisopliae]|nr:hypothetical protein E5D57_005824 [Metarhizium anisopliae]
METAAKYQWILDHQSTAYQRPRMIGSHKPTGGKRWTTQRTAHSYKKHQTQNPPAALRAWQMSWQLLGEQLHDQLARSKGSWQSWQIWSAMKAMALTSCCPFSTRSSVSHHLRMRFNLPSQPRPTSFLSRGTAPALC